MTPLFAGYKAHYVTQDSRKELGLKTGMEAETALAVGGAKNTQVTFLLLNKGIMGNWALCHGSVIPAVAAFITCKAAETTNPHLNFWGWIVNEWPCDLPIPPPQLPLPKGPDPLSNMHLGFSAGC